MQLTINIPEDEIIEMGKQMAAEALAKAIRNGWQEGYAYRKIIKEVVRGGK